MIKKFLVYKLLYAVSVTVVCLDRLSKYWVVNTIPPNTYDPPAETIIPGFLYLVRISNSGAAWGILSGYGTALAILGVLALIGIYWFRRDLQLKTIGSQCAFGLLIAGIIGNIIDRMLYEGSVIDFIDVHLPGYRWPAFNVADSAITIGVILYLVLSFKGARGSDRRKIKETE